MTTKKFFKYYLDEDKSAEPLNEYGYRGPIVDSEKKILFLGCSITYGYGVKYNETFAYQTAKLLGEEWSLLNFGVPGSGPDIQIITAAWALNNFKIDKICWLMSHPMRTQIIMEDGANLKFAINSNPDGVIEEYRNKYLLNKFVENHIYFEKNNLTKVTQHLYTLFSLIKQKNIDCYVTCWEDNFDDTVEELRDEFGFKKLDQLVITDIASDGMHPGPQSHLNFAKILNERMKNEK